MQINLIEQQMKKTSKIYIAGHRGLVGSAIVKNLESKGYTNLWLIKLMQKNGCGMNNLKFNIKNSTLSYYSLPSRDEIKEVLDFTEQLFARVCTILEIDKSVLICKNKSLTPISLT